MDETVATYFRQQLSESIDRYRDNDTFLCLFCNFEEHDPISLFFHLLQAHQFSFSNISRIPLLPKYLEYWRIHVPPLITIQFQGKQVQTIDNSAPEDISIRQNLHQIRLDAIMQEHERERTEINENIPCLFCTEKYTGTWQGYLQYLFVEHQFNPGRPSNLIYIKEFISRLRNQLDSNACIFCQAVFPNQRTLRSHMRKKKHMKIPTDPSFDRFYMVNYRDLDKESWQNHDLDENDNDKIDPDHMESLETAAQDFNDTEISETCCLLCSLTFPSPEDCKIHMKTQHCFDIVGIRNSIGNDFYNTVKFINFARYMKNQNQCFVCGHQVNGDYAAHIEQHSSKVPQSWDNVKGDDQFLLPIIDNDPLLTVLEDD